MLKLIEISPDEESCDLPTRNDLISSVCEAVSQLYGKEGFVRPWIGYFATLEGRVVGTCSFKSPPRANHVEIAYFTFPDWEGRGIGTEMARKLIEVARMADPKVTVVAQTLPEENASTRILGKLGFSQTGTVVHLDDGLVWQWELNPHRENQP